MNLPSGMEVEMIGWAPGNNLRTIALLIVGFASLLAGCGGSDEQAAPIVQEPDAGFDASIDVAADSAQGTDASGDPTTDPLGSDSALDVPADLPPACSATDPRAVPVQLFVEPDSSEAPFVSALTPATKSIRVMVYMMGFGGIFDTLKQKAGAGVQVRVILDQSQISVNQKYFDQLTAAGAQVRWSDPKFKYMHAKAIVIDDAVSVISTGNYLKSQIDKERNYVMRDEDPQDVGDLAALFDADWDKKAPDLSCTRLVVSPVNARDRILAVINAAQKTLVVESMQFADDEVRTAVATRKAAGVDVRVLLADPSWITANTDAAAFLASTGISARWMASPAVHVKSIVADGVLAYAGSENLSWTSLSSNREVGLVMSEPAANQAMADTFEKDWATAQTFP